MQEHNLFQKFIRPLNELGIKYIVTGAAASIIYGEPRLTNDIDIVIEMENKDVNRFIENFPSSEYYVPPKEIILIEKGRAERGHINLIDQATGFKADIYFVGYNKLSKWALDNYKNYAFSGTTIRLAPPEYVIAMKLEYYREGGHQKHINDVEAILSNSATIIDFEILNNFIADYALEKEWKVVRK
ncbi:MAG: hypothetical protein Q8K98_01705 [Bacteroidota bacterium]|nr:hypothetical protein [Bacteroidota bacterium]